MIQSTISIDLYICLTYVGLLESVMQGCACTCTLKQTECEYCQEIPHHFVKKLVALVVANLVAGTISRYSMPLEVTHSICPYTCSLGLKVVNSC